jgi:hypothetical protein
MKFPWTKTNPPTQVKLIGSFCHDKPPFRSIKLTLHHYQTKRSFDIHASTGKYEFKCPVCRTLLYMRDGDRILCTCGHALEVYGNSLRYWEFHQSDRQHVFYEYPKLYNEAEISMYDKITENRDIAAQARDHEMIKDAIHELETIIKLHE